MTCTLAVGTVKLANSASPFKFHQVKFPNKLVLRMIGCVFPEHGQLNSVTLFENTSFSKSTCCEAFAWQNLKGLAELANYDYTVLLFII